MRSDGKRVVQESAFKLQNSLGIQRFLGCSSLRLGLDIGVLVGAPHGCGRFREREKLLVVMSFVVIFSGRGKSQ